MIDETQRSEDRYLHLLEAVGDYTYTVSIEDGRPVRTIHGSKCEAVTGYTPSEYEAIPLLWCGMIYEADRNAVTEHVARLLRGEAVPPVEHRIIRKDGSIRWIRNTAVLRYDENGKVIAYDGLIEDITERKEVENTLREREESYSSLFKNMLDGFAYCRMLFDDQGCPVDFVYLDVNDAFEKLTGLRDVVGKKVSGVIPGIRKSNPELFHIYSRVALTGTPEKFETYVEPLGIWFSVAVYSPGKEYFIAVFDNITERKLAEEELAKHVDELERYMKATIKREGKVKELRERVKRLEGELRKV